MNRARCHKSALWRGGGAPAIRLWRGGRRAKGETGPAPCLIRGLRFNPDTTPFISAIVSGRRRRRWTLSASQRPTSSIPSTARSRSLGCCRGSSARCGAANGRPIDAASRRAGTQSCSCGRCCSESRCRSSAGSTCCHASAFARSANGWLGSSRAGASSSWTGAVAHGGRRELPGGHGRLAARCTSAHRAAEAIDLLRWTGGRGKSLVRSPTQGPLEVAARTLKGGPPTSGASLGRVTRELVILDRASALARSRCGTHHYLRNQYTPASAFPTGSPTRKDVSSYASSRRGDKKSVICFRVRRRGPTGRQSSACRLPK